MALPVTDAEATKRNACHIRHPASPAPHGDLLERVNDALYRVKHPNPAPKRR